MSFFFAGQASAPRTKGPSKAPARAMPRELLQSMGCTACPRSTACSARKSPLLEPTGPGAPVFFVLGSPPTEADDRAGDWFRDEVGAELLRQFRAGGVLRDCALGGIAQCRAVDADDEGVVLECCRGRVHKQIEQMAPPVVVTVGDAAFRWATGVAAGVLTWHGTMFPAQFGQHVCWVLPLAQPNYALKKKSYGTSEWEHVLRGHVARMAHMVRSGELPDPQVITSGHDDGVEILDPTDRKAGTELQILQRLERGLEDLAREPQVGLDIETNGLRVWKVPEPRLLTVAVGTPERTLVWPLAFKEAWSTRAHEARAHALLGEFLIHSGNKVAHNLAMEQTWLSWFYGDRVLHAGWDDTMLAAHTVDEREGTKGLGRQTRLHFGFDLKALSNVDAARLEDYPLRRVLRYNGMDAKWTAALMRRYDPILDATPAYRVEYERKLRLCPALVATEALGVPSDLDYARQIEAQWNGKVAAAQKAVARAPEVQQYEQRYRHTFQPGNDDHVLRLYKDLMQRPEVRVEERGTVRFTTEEAVLSSMPAREVPSAAAILEHRGSVKLLSTYVTPLLHGTMRGTDGLIHTQYSSTVAETGRLNSEDPNLQNFPKRKNKEVRGMITAPDGHWLMPCDYGQIEFRVAGMCSEDENLVKYCWTGYDVHKAWAELIVQHYPQVKDWIVREFSVDWDEKGLKTLRQESKNKWVFPCIFGASVKSRASGLHLPVEVAQKLDRIFWDEFKGVKRWQERIVQFYEKHLYVETLMGRRRRGALSLNQIINMPIQGTAADIVTAAMTALSERSRAEEWRSIHPLINVHDDLTFLPRVEEQQAVAAVVAEEMCMHRFPWVITPLVVEISLGRRWHECKEVAVVRSDELFSMRNPFK